ncbi:ATP-binding cassette domain-containing protein, partial [Priestia sp. SIMBA_032]|uniref:ATP-binding cassette domain-containing protein n=1 Tax=Priestia sp. SIMBA_032 TaxID=3085775 RepID=UPI0039797BFE
HGHVLGLVGPNGAGKTTLVDCIVGTQSSSSGVVALEGQALKAGSTIRAQAGLARTFQHPQLALELSPIENIVPALVAR